MTGSATIAISALLDSSYTTVDAKASTNGAYDGVYKQTVTIPSNNCIFFALNASYNDSQSSEGGSREITSFTLTTGTYERLGRYYTFGSGYRACNVFLIKNAKNATLTMNGNSYTNGTGWAIAYK